MLSSKDAGLTLIEDDRGYSKNKIDVHRNNNFCEHLYGVVAVMISHLTITFAGFTI